MKFFFGFIAFLIRDIFKSVLRTVIVFFINILEFFGDLYLILKKIILGYRMKFAHTLRRTLEVLITELLLSCAVSALVWFGLTGWMPGLLLKIFTRYLCVVYCVIQLFFIFAFCENTDSIQFVTTNIFAYVMLTFFACVSAYVARFYAYGNIVHTWLFMPFKMFYYLGILGRTGSALVVGVMLCLETFLVRIIYILRPKHYDY